MAPEELEALAVSVLKERCEAGDLTPADLSLPEKFRRFLSVQLQALQSILHTEAKVVLLQAPTGAGKTLIMASLPPLLGTQALYTCHTKSLQNQVASDFPEAVILKGRANYPCLKAPLELTADECTQERQNCLTCAYGPCPTRKQQLPDGSKCPCTTACPYVIQKQMALRAPLAVLNLPLFLGEANFVGGFSGWPWAVLDEGDLTEAGLLDFVGVTITARQIERLHLPLPRAKTVSNAWVEWACQVLPGIGSEAFRLEREGTPQALREAKECRRLKGKLEFLLTQNLDHWVFIPEEERWAFKPVFVSGYAGPHLWRHASRFLVMSATILSPEQFARDLGLSPREVAFIDLPSTFPKERRPIHFRPQANMIFKQRETAWPAMARAVDEVLAAHPEEKGLIHTVSYGLGAYLLEHSTHAQRLLFHNPKNRGAMLEAFKRSPEPAVLLSPSMERGVDLPYDLCRFIVIAKIAYPNQGDPQVTRRLYGSTTGPLWYATQTIRALIQATGRGMRATDDSCVTYILDAQFERLYSEHSGLFPAWWREALGGL